MALLKSLSYGTARLFKMRTVIEAAATDVGGKINKIILKLLFGNDSHHLYLKGGKAGSVGNKGVLPQLIKLHVAGGMLAASKLLTDFARFNMDARNKLIEYA